MELAIILASITAGLCVLLLVGMIIGVEYIDHMHKELEELKHLDEDDEDVL